MESNKSVAQEIFSLNGTKWSVTTGSNTLGTFHFKNDNSGTYTTESDPEVKFYWWLNGSSFWTQEKDSDAGWFSIMVGRLTADNIGSGQIVVAQQGQDAVYSTHFSMTKDPA